MISNSDAPWVKRVAPTAGGMGVLQVPEGTRDRFLHLLPSEVGERPGAMVFPPTEDDPMGRRRAIEELTDWLAANPLSLGVPRLTREDLHERR